MYLLLDCISDAALKGSHTLLPFREVAVAQLVDWSSLILGSSRLHEDRVKTLYSSSYGDG